MKRKIQFIPHAGTIPGEHLPMGTQDAIRREVGPTNISYKDGQQMMSREGVLHLAEGIIAGRIAGNVEAARTMKAEILAKYPAPDGR